MVVQQSPSCVDDWVPNFRSRYESRIMMTSGIAVLPTDIELCNVLFHLIIIISWQDNNQNLILFHLHSTGSNSDTNIKKNLICTHQLAFVFEMGTHKYCVKALSSSDVSFAYIKASFWRQSDTACKFPIVSVVTNRYKLTLIKMFRTKPLHKHAVIFAVSFSMCGRCLRKIKKESVI